MNRDIPLTQLPVESLNVVPGLRWSRVGIHIGVCLFGILTSLVIIEIAFRLFAPAILRSARWNDRPRFYYKPEGAPTLQDFAYAPEKPSGTFRVAVIGDSFSFGPYLQFDDTFPKRLERMLNLNQTKMRGEVLNYGVAGFSTHDEINLMKRAIQEQADVAILQITLNDPQLRLITPGSNAQKYFEPLHISEHEYPLLYYWRTLGFVAQRIHNQISRRRYEQFFFGLFDGKDTWNSFSSSLQEFARLRDKSGVKLVAVVFPLLSFGIDDDYPFAPLHEKIKTLLANLQIPELDLLTAYHNIPSERLFVSPPSDLHPNEIAHRIAAERIYSFLMRQQLIPEELRIRERFVDRLNSKVYHGKMIKGR